MLISKDLKDYLHGRKIEYKEFYFNKQKERWNRIELIKKILCKRTVGERMGKAVIHLGCCDHKRLIKQKRKSGTWLHDILMKNSRIVAGIDIDKEAVEILQEELKIPYILYADVTKEVARVREWMSTILGDEKWNYLICGEIIEHVDNPVEFLKIINEEYFKQIEKIIITVPNAFRRVNFKHALYGFEKINSDHKYWFTPYTILRVMEAAGINVEEIYFTGFTKSKFSKFISKFNQAISGNEIVVIGKLQGKM